MHPQQHKSSFKYWQAFELEEKIKFSKKDSKKLVGKEKALYFCTRFERD
ncbi:hypothetical protein FEM08_33660 [Flavobacterium gilvum]|nr:hypothetical protein FEM08_33660 [Flavobacterium gilvum]